MMTACTALLVLLTVGGQAQAYEYKMTERGHKVRWHKAHIQFVLDESLSVIAPMDQIENLVAEVFDQWVDTALLPVEFSFRVGTCERFGYDSRGNNENCILADAPYTTDRAAATTRMTYDPTTGIIKDADILVSNEPDKWTLDHNLSRLNLRAALLHEVGHALGLSHSEIDEAIMAPEINTGTPATLYVDDIEGASTLYEGMETDAPEMMCSTVTVGRTSTASLALMLMVVLARFSLPVVRTIRRRRG